MSAIRERTGLCIIDLPKKLTSRRNLRAHFSKFGDITNVSVDKDVRSALVTFASHFDAQSAKTQGKIYEDKSLCIYWSEISSADPRSKFHKEKPDEEDAVIEDKDLWRDDEKETFGVDSVQPKKSEGQNKSAENLIQQHLKLPIGKKRLGSQITGVKRRLGLQIKPGDGSKIKAISVKSSTKPGKISPKMLLASKRNPLTQVNKHKLVRKVAVETGHSAMSKSKTSLNVEDQPSKGVPPMTERTDLKMKLALLDERDKMIRTKTKQDSNIKTAVSIKGTCPDMCPERERIMRQFSLSVAVYEMVPGTYEMDENKAVKEYTRSSADQEVPLPHDLRSERVLSMTMNYLITNIINKVDNPDENKAIWYSFCWNRLRSIRKDIIVQQLCDTETVKIVEQCARFHICCYDHMWGAEVSGFDDKINTQNLIDCLQTLRHMYEDLAKHNVACPNEPEFYSYLILSKLKSGDVMWEYQQYSLEIQLSREVQFAIQAYMAFKNNMYSKFFSLVKKASYLTSCLLQRYFNEVRTQALKTMLKAYCLPGKTVGLSSSFIVSSLKFDSQSNALKFCDRDEVELKVDCEKNEDDIYVSDSSFLIREKRLPIANAVVGVDNPLPVYLPHQVHSSFDEFGKLKHSLYYEGESEVASSEDVSDCMEDSYCTEDSLYMEECDESEASVVSAPEVSIQKTPFKFSLSPNATQGKENIFAKTMDTAQFYDTNLFKPFSFSNEFKENSSLEVVPILEEDSDCRNIEMDIPVENSPFCKQQSTMFSKSQDMGFQQTFFSQSVFSSKNTSTLGKFEENKSISQNIKDAKSVFSFSVNSVEAKKSEEISNYKNESTINTFNFDSSEKNSSGCEKQSSKSCSYFNDTIIMTPVISLNQFEQSEFAKEDKKEYAAIKAEEEREALIIERLLKEKAEEEKLQMEELRRKAEEKKRKEIEEKKIIQHLKKDLRERLKADNARKYVRHWKEKVAKLKRMRADFPMLVQLSVKDHLWKWGSVNSVPVGSIFQRAKDKKNLSGVSLQLLRTGITDSCKYIGLDLAEALANFAVKSMRKGDIKPVFWKLAFSVPWLNSSSSELTVFNQLMKMWCKQSFYKVTASQLGSVESTMTSMGIPVNVSVHFSETLHTSQNIQAMDALVFVVLNETETEKMCLQRLRSLVVSQPKSEEFSVAVMNIGGVRLERVLKIELEELHELNLVANWSINNWLNPTSIFESLMFLAKNVSIAPHICASPLEILVRQVCEEFFDALSSGQHSSIGLAEAVKDPNNVIYLYNTCLTKLKDLLMSRNLEKYFVFAEEFKVCISPGKSGGPELLCGKQWDDTYKSEVSKKIASLKLKEMQKWPPKSSSHLFKVLKQICVEVNDLNIFPQIIRMLDIPDDADLAEYLQQVSWLNVIELLVQCNVRHCFSSRDRNKRLFVIFSKTDTQRLTQLQWWLRLPIVVQSETC